MPLAGGTVCKGMVAVDWFTSSALLEASGVAAEGTAVVAWEGAVEGAVFVDVDESVLALKVSLTGDFGVGSSLPPVESLVFFFLRRLKFGMMTGGGGGGQCGECGDGVGASEGAQLAGRGQRKRCARAMQMPEYDRRALVSRWELVCRRCSYFRQAPCLLPGRRPSSSISRA